MCHGEKLRALSDARDGAETFVEMDRRTAARARAPRGSARKGLKRLEGGAGLVLVINRLFFVGAAKVAEMEGMGGGAIAREHDEGAATTCAHGRIGATRSLRSSKWTAGPVALLVSSRCPS